MKINNNVTRIGGYLALLPIAYGIWWMAGHVAQAEDQAAEQAELKEVIFVLKDIHVAQQKQEEQDQAVEEAEAALIEKLCRSGKLEGDECPAPPPPVVVSE